MSFEFPIFEKILKMNERQLKDYMVNFLTENYRRVENNKHFVLAYGNIPIALCAHLDTVYGDTPNFVFHDEKHGVIWSPQGLGADDRAGIYAIIRLIEDGFRPHIILTTEEETGCNGALELVLETYRTSPFDNLKYIIELDRQGFNDCVFYECGNEKFHDYIQQFGFKEQKGSFSDISFICPMWKVCGVNLSIGYYYEHSPAEFLVEGMFEDILALVKIMLSEKSIPHFDWILIPADKPTMEGFEFLISLREQADIAEKIETIIKSVHRIPTDIHADKLVMDAISAKGKFIKAFGNKLIYECPEEIEITISPQQKHLLFLEFLEAIENYKYYFNFDWNNITDEEVRNVIEFLENNEEGFYDNCVKWYSEEYKCIKKGAKLVRSLKHFIKDKDVLVAIQDAASRYIQMNKIKGYLCLSVHPLDFLSLSDNSANWSSCHSLTSERCAGNLSYMCDYSTVICYIKSSNNDFVFPNTNISWNNKKWRMLLYTNNTNSLIVTGRQYPYEIIDGLNIVQKYLLEPVGMINETLNGYSDWQTVSPGTKTWESGSLAECFFDFDDYLFKVKTIVRDATLPTVAPLHYNDVLYSTIAKPHYKYMKGLSEDLEYPGQSIKVGRAIKCLHCEEKVIDFADVFLCTSCEMKYGGIETMTFGTCDGCGGRMIWDQSQETEEGEWICPDCVKNSYKRCNRCGMLLGKKGIPLIDEKELCLWCEDDVNRGEPIDNLPGEEINNG